MPVVGMSVDVRSSCQTPTGYGETVRSGQSRSFAHLPCGPLQGGAGFEIVLKKQQVAHRGLVTQNIGLTAHAPHESQQSDRNSSATCKQRFLGEHTTGNQPSEGRYFILERQRCGRGINLHSMHIAAQLLQGHEESFLNFLLNISTEHALIRDCLKFGGNLVRNQIHRLTKSNELRRVTFSDFNNLFDGYLLKVSWNDRLDRNHSDCFGCAHQFLSVILTSTFQIAIQLLRQPRSCRAGYQDVAHPLLCPARADCVHLTVLGNRSKVIGSSEVLGKGGHVYARQRWVCHEPGAIGRGGREVMFQQQIARLEVELRLRNRHHTQIARRYSRSSRIYRDVSRWMSRSVQTITVSQCNKIVCYKLAEFPAGVPEVEVEGYSWGRNVYDEVKFLSKLTDSVGIRRAVSVGDDPRHLRPVERGGLDPGVGREVDARMVQANLAHRRPPRSANSRDELDTESVHHGLAGQDCKNFGRGVHVDERGSVAAELTLLVPALITLLLFVVFCGRLAEARLRVEDAAHQAARAATIARSAGQADADARATSQAALDDAGMSCRALTIDTRLADLRPGGTVSVTVTCQVGVSDLALLAVPASISVSASAESIVDRWRGGPPPPGQDAP